MSIVADEAEDYANSQDYDCCQIIEGAFTVGDAIIEAYAAGRLARNARRGAKSHKPPSNKPNSENKHGTEWAHGISTYDEVRRISPPHGPQFERKDQSWRQSTRFP